MIHAIYVTYIFAIVDAQGDGYEKLGGVHAYGSWHLILQALKYIFRYDYYYDEESKEILEEDDIFVEALPPLVAYAMSHWEQWDNRVETYRLIQLASQVCHKLEEERCQIEGIIASRQHGQKSSFRYREIRNLAKQIRELLNKVYA